MIQLVLKSWGPKAQPELLIQGRNGMAYMAFVLFTLNTDPTIQMSQQTKQPFSNLLLSNFGEPVLIAYPQFPVLSWNEWSSAAVAHLLQGLRDVLWLTSVVTSGYLSHCCLSICLKQSGHSLGPYEIRFIFSKIPFYFFLNAFMNHNFSGFRFFPF